MDPRDVGNQLVRNEWKVDIGVAYQDFVLPPSIRSDLVRALPYGCGFAMLLGLSMAFVIFVGSVMGDCEPGPGCHDKDGAVIAGGLAVAVPIVLILGVGVWLIFTAAFSLLKERVSGKALIVLFSLIVPLLLWLSLGPALEIHFSWSGG